MRLGILASGHRPLQKTLLALTAVVTDEQAPGPMRVLSYRRELFGEAFAACVQEALRGGHAWSLGEVELFAAFVSRLNECKY